jgi:hypothetical protein
MYIDYCPNEIHERKFRESYLLSPALTTFSPLERNKKIFFLKEIFCLPAKMQCSQLIQNEKPKENKELNSSSIVNWKTFLTLFALQWMLNITKYSPIIEINVLNSYIL